MIIGIPKEIKDNEKRVSLLPHLIQPIADKGHEVIIQAGAGLESGFPDKLYKEEGAKIVPALEDIYNQSDIKMDTSDWFSQLVICTPYGKSLPRI